MPWALLQLVTLWLKKKGIRKMEPFVIELHIFGQILLQSTHTIQPWLLANPVSCTFQSRGFSPALTWNWWTAIQNFCNFADGNSVIHKHLQRLSVQKPEIKHFAVTGGMLYY